jgi:hypothetical protein
MRPHTGGGHGLFGGYALFVHQLGAEQDEAFLHDLFSQCGMVASIKVVRDPQTGRSRVRPHPKG